MMIEVAGHARKHCQQPNDACSETPSSCLGNNDVFHQSEMLYHTDIAFVFQRARRESTIIAYIINP